MSKKKKTNERAWEALADEVSSVFAAPAGRVIAALTHDDLELLRIIHRLPLEVLRDRDETIVAVRATPDSLDRTSDGRCEIDLWDNSGIPRFSLCVHPSMFDDLRDMLDGIDAHAREEAKKTPKKKGKKS